MKTETIADIVREMRENKGIPVPFAPTNAVWIDDFKAYADRIEAAHERERGATCEKSSQVGDAAKMREALHKARLFAGCCPMPFVEIAMGVVVRDKLCDEIDAALSAPPRNCDKCKNADEAVALAVDAGVVDCAFGAREMAEFLLAEAKGEDNGSK